MVTLAIASDHFGKWLAIWQICTENGQWPAGQQLFLALPCPPTAFSTASSSSFPLPPHLASHPLFHCPLTPPLPPLPLLSHLNPATHPIFTTYPPPTPLTLPLAPTPFTPTSSPYWKTPAMSDAVLHWGRTPFTTLYVIE